jgi:hypothetical protein
MPKKMKPSATAKKAAGPKKKMKTNQDGGSILSEDPGAAGKQLVANQKGAAKTYGGNKGDESAKTKAKVKTVKEDATKDYEGGARMGYSQKFGAGRMNGYDMGAAKVDDIMKGGAKMMTKGPSQGRFDEMNERLQVNKDNAARTAKREKDANFTPTDVKSGRSFNQGMQGQLRSEMTKNVTKGEDGYYTGDIHPEQPRSKGSKGYDEQQVKFEQHNFQAKKKANQYNRMINKEKESQGIDVAKEAASRVAGKMKNYKFMM